MEKHAGVLVEKAGYQRLFKCKGTSALRVKQAYPRLVDKGAATGKINRYYQAVVDRWRQRWEGELHRRVCDAMEENATGALPWEAAYDFVVTYNRDGLLSLYADAYEFTGGAHGNTVRRGDTWELATGAPRTLYSFFPNIKNPREYVLQQAVAVAEAQQASGEHLFFDDYVTGIREQFDPDRFYLTEEGIAIFYPLYSISPYAEGFPTFFVTNVDNFNK